MLLKYIKKLRCLRFECFIDINVMTRTLYDCLGTRILSSRADGTLEENIRAVMHSNIFHISISLIIYLVFENYLRLVPVVKKNYL